MPWVKKKGDIRAFRAQPASFWEGRIKPSGVSGSQHSACSGQIFPKPEALPSPWLKKPTKQTKPQKSPSPQAIQWQREKKKKLNPLVFVTQFLLHAFPTNCQHPTGICPRYTSQHNAPDKGISTHDVSGSLSNRPRCKEVHQLCN